MAIGTTAALIGLGITTAAKAATDIYSTNKAVKQQQAGTDAAKTEAARMWGIQQENNRPYVEAGRNSASLLGRLMTPGVAYNDPRYGGPPNGMLGPRTTPPSPSPVPPIGGPGGPAGPRPMGGSMGAAMLGPGATVKLQAPDGSTRDIPVAQAGRFLRMPGVRRIG